MGAIIFHLRQLSQSADLPIRFKSANLESVGPTNTNFRIFYGSLNYLHQWAEAGQQSWAMQCGFYFIEHVKDINRNVFIERLRF